MVVDEKRDTTMTSCTGRRDRKCSVAGCKHPFVPVMNSAVLIPVISYIIIYTHRQAAHHHEAVSSLYLLVFMTLA